MSLQNDEETMYKVLSRLENGENMQTVANDLEVSYSKVRSWKVKYDKAKEAGMLNDVFNIDRLIIAQAADTVAEKLPEELAKEAKGKVATLTNGLDGLESLSTELQQTARRLNQRIQALVTSSEHPSELEVYTKCICDLQNSFFAKGTQVNVQNNYGANENTGKYKEFLSD